MAGLGSEFSLLQAQNLRLIQVALPIFLLSLARAEDSSSIHLTQAGLSTLLFELDSADILTLTAYQEQTLLSTIEDCSNELLEYLEGRTSERILNRDETRPEVSKEEPFPKLKAMSALRQSVAKSVSKDELSTYVDLLQTSDGESISLTATLEKSESLLATLKTITTSRISSKEDHPKLMEAILDAQLFRNSSVTLFKQIANGMSCNIEHQAHVHLSGFGLENWELESLFTPCHGHLPYSNGYPVMFCRSVPTASRSSKTFTEHAFDLCSVVSDPWNLSKEIKVHHEEGRGLEPRFGTRGTVSKAHLSMTCLNVSQSLAEKTLGIGPAQIRRLQCLIAQSLLFLGNSPWLSNPGAIESLRLMDRRCGSELHSIYSTYIFQNTAESATEDQDAFRTDFDIEVFMARVGLLLLQLEHQECLSLNEEEQAEQGGLGYIVALQRYTASLSTDPSIPRPPKAVQKIIEECYDFQSWIDDTCPETLHDADLRLRLTISMRILRPLVIDLAEYHTDLYHQTPTLRKFMDLWRIESGTADDALKEEKLQELEKVQTLLHAQKVQLRQPRREWVPQAAIREVWTKIRLRDFLITQGADMVEQAYDKIERDHLSLISTLVTINWHKWPYLHHLLASDKDGILHDQKFPVNRTEIFTGYLRPNEITLFQDIQYRYVHICLPDLAPNRTTRRLPSESYLPFVISGHEIFSGKAGVSKETVPPGCLIHNGSANLAPVRVARKVVTNNSQRVEEHIATILNGSLTQHSGVMGILSMYYLGGNLEIISPLAETNLEVFMTDQIYDEYWSTTEALAELLIEMRTIASALEHLHNGLADRTRRDSSICHMDLKPDNILVFIGNEKRGSENHKVFRFKIVDFGVATTQPRYNHVLDLDSEDVLREVPVESPPNKAGRPAEAHSAPEMHHSPERVGPKSDVWSFACILIRALVRKLRGSDALILFDTERESDGDDYFFVAKTPDVLKPVVRLFLHDLPNPESHLGKAITQCLKRSPPECRMRGPNYVRPIVARALKEALVAEDTRTSAAQLYQTLKELSWNS